MTARNKSQLTIYSCCELANQKVGVYTKYRAGYHWRHFVHA